MSKIKEETEVPVIQAKISILWLTPTILASCICPSCQEISFVQVYSGENKAPILTCCTVCGEDYKMIVPAIPEFSKVKNNSNG